jgi:hypothetical protein
VALRITIDIFSGRPNPVLILEGPEEKEALDRLRPEAELRGRELRPLPASTLGYRGLIIEQTGRATRGLPKEFRVANGDIVAEDFAARPADPAFEEFVCGSTGPIRRISREPDLPEFILKEIKRLDDLRKKWKPGRPEWPRRARCRCAPLYEPDWWNVPAIQPHNNCYNYGCDYRTDTFAQPGLAASAMYTALSCASVRPAAVADALINSPTANNRCPREGHLVALVIAPGWDFHWFRKGRNGYWSHKPGGTPVTNLDNSAVTIPDPRTADRGPYTQFCTFMVVMHGHIKIE